MLQPGIHAATPGLQARSRSRVGGTCPAAADALGEFIKQVGPVPDKEALAVYLRRMREHGWDVSPTIRKALQCGASIMPEVGPLCMCCAYTLNPKPCQWLYSVKHVCWLPASV